MTKLLEGLRTKILNSFIYTFIASFCKWASGAYFFTPGIYNVYKVRHEMVQKMLWVSWAKSRVRHRRTARRARRSTPPPVHGRRPASPGPRRG